MKRYRPRAQGRGYQILKRSSQISVVLSDDKNYRPISKAEARKLAKAAAESAVVEEVSEKPAKKKAAAKKTEAKSNKSEEEAK